MPMQRPRCGAEARWTSDHITAQLLLHQQCQLWETNVVADLQTKIGRGCSTTGQGIAHTRENGDLIARRQAV